MERIKKSLVQHLVKNKRAGNQPNSNKNNNQNTNKKIKNVFYFSIQSPHFILFQTFV